MRNSSELDARRFQALRAPLISPFFSPDGQWVGFFDVQGQPQEDRRSRGAPVITSVVVEWAPRRELGRRRHDRARSGAQRGLWRVNAAGGTPELDKPDRRRVRAGTRHSCCPWRLRAVHRRRPASRTADRREEAQIAVQSLATGERKTLVAGRERRPLRRSGHLLYARGRCAVRRGVRPRSPGGGRRPRCPSLEGSRGLNRRVDGPPITRAPNGTLVYSDGAGGWRRRQLRTLVWVDRDRAARKRCRRRPARVPYARLSPDGTRVALEVRDEQPDIWVWHLIRQTLTRLTFDPGKTNSPRWSPDGTAPGIFVRGGGCGRQPILAGGGRHRISSSDWYGANGQHVSRRPSRPDSQAFLFQRGCRAGEQRRYWPRVAARR